MNSPVIGNLIYGVESIVFYNSKEGVFSSKKCLLNLFPTDSRGKVSPIVSIPRKGDIVLLRSAEDLSFTGKVVNVLWYYSSGNCYAPVIEVYLEKWQQKKGKKR